MDSYWGFGIIKEVNYDIYCNIKLRKMTFFASPSIILKFSHADKNVLVGIYK